MRTVKMKIMKQPGLGAISLGLLFCLIYWAGQVEAREHKGENSLNVRHVLGPLYNFTGKLYLTLNDGEGEPKNIIVSPISIHKALNLALLGTKPNTETERELHHAMAYSGLSKNYVLECHKDYARVLKEFERITKKALDRIREGSEKDKREKDKTRYAREPPYPPVIDLFNMVITKNAAKVLPEYREKIEQHYNSSIKNVNDKRPETKTKVMDHLNGWAKGAGFQSPIMSREELDKDFQAIVLSAIRLQASWADTFSESKGKAIFYNQGLKDKPVSGTYLSHHQISGARRLIVPPLPRDPRGSGKASKQIDFDRSGPRLLRELDAEILSVPLDGGVSLTIFQPKNHSTPGNNKLQNLVELLFAKQHLSMVLNMLDSREPSKVGVTMPKFEFEKELDLKPILKSMGLKRAFDNRSEISSITKDPLQISGAKHKAMIEVNEKGIKAAAVTRIDFIYLSAPIQHVRVKIDKPFVFLIRYGGVPLFVGQLSSLQPARE